MIRYLNPAPAGKQRSVVAKVRVYELAKEFGVESKAVMAELEKMGEFVRSASSTIEAPVVRRLKESFASDGGKQGQGAGRASAPQRAGRPGPAGGNGQPGNGDRGNRGPARPGVPAPSAPAAPAPQAPPAARPAAGTPAARIPHARRPLGPSGAAR